MRPMDRCSSLLFDNSILENAPHGFHSYGRSQSQWNCVDEFGNAARPRLSFSSDQLLEKFSKFEFFFIFEFLNFEKYFKKKARILNSNSRIPKTGTM